VPGPRFGVVSIVGSDGPERSAKWTKTGDQSLEHMVRPYLLRGWINFLVPLFEKRRTCQAARPGFGNPPIDRYPPGAARAPRADGRPRTETGAHSADRLWSRTAEPRPTRPHPEGRSRWPPSSPRRADTRLQRDPRPLHPLTKLGRPLVTRNFHDRSADRVGGTTPASWTANWRQPTRSAGSRRVPAPSAGSREAWPHDSVVTVATCGSAAEAGADRGPCSAENRTSGRGPPRGPRRPGVDAAASGSSSPRPRPTAPGLGRAGVAACATCGPIGLPVVSELMSVRDLDILPGWRHAADRRPQHAELHAAERGRQAGRPILLKRGLAATVPSG